MTDSLKNLIEKAPIKRSGIFSEFLIIPSGEKYDGFWGVNGYNSIIMLGKLNGEWVNITTYADSIMFGEIRHASFDVPTEYNCVRLWLDEPIRIANELDLSTVIGYPTIKK